MTNKKESKKLNSLSLNKETISDLDAPQEQDVVGGAGLSKGCSTGPAQCIPQSSGGPQDPRCKSVIHPVLCIKANI